MAEHPKTPQDPARRIRSFVLREGRMTNAQQRALDELLPRFGVEPGPGLLDFAAVFGRPAPVVLEIGFGNGESLAAMAKAHPEYHYLGIEMHRPGIGHLLLRLQENSLDNVRVIRADAQEVLARNVPDGSLHGVQLFFPDPWPKKRHHKRRIVQTAWAELVRRKLEIGGFLHLATDWENYAEHMLETLGRIAGFSNPAGPGQFSPRPPQRPVTRFESRGQRLGHNVRDLIFIRVA
jgi:tRNA (guanine-N7-)-methyltransferase